MKLNGVKSGQSAQARDNSRKFVSRRSFLTATAWGTMAFLAHPGWVLAKGAGQVDLEIGPELGWGNIPEDFTGLGYEISSVSQPGVMNSVNRKMVQLIRTLGSQGVIRVGGNTSDYAHWSAEGAAVSAPEASVVNAAVIQDLGGLLEALNWRLIWGLNLGSGSEAEAVAEAKAVSASAGKRLLALQVGNEVDLFVPAHRPKGWGQAEYLAEYRRYRQAIRAELPTAPFAGPDAAVRTDWVKWFARAEGAGVNLLTHHYYAGGPPSSPAMTIEHLLGDRKIDGILRELESISRGANIPFRICEMNSCFGGGKPGVSDTFASALWILDLMFKLAMHGSAGINVETGVNQLGFVSSYSPIYPDENRGYVARPIYYGMLAFAQASRGRMLATATTGDGLNFKAYAVRNTARQMTVTLINKELSTPIGVRLKKPGKVAGARLMRMSAPGIESKTGVKLAGAEVDDQGRWRPKTMEEPAVVDSEVYVRVPPVSAVVMRIYLS